MCIQTHLFPKMLQTVVKSLAYRRLQLQTALQTALQTNANSIIPQKRSILQTVKMPSKTSVKGGVNGKFSVQRCSHAGEVNDYEIFIIWAKISLIKLI